MKEALDALLEGVQTQLGILNQLEDSKKVQKAIPMAQLSILAILTTAVIMFVQHEVE